MERSNPDAAMEIWGLFYMLRMRCEKQRGGGGGGVGRTDLAITQKYETKAEIFWY